MRHSIPNRTTIPALLAAGAVLALLAGCGGGSPQPPETAGQTAPAGVSGQATSQPESPLSRALDHRASPRSDSQRPPDRSPADEESATKAASPKAAGDGISLPADSAAARDILRSLAHEDPRKDSSNSIQGKLKKVVSQLTNGDHDVSHATHNDVPTAVEKVLKQLRETPSP